MTRSPSPTLFRSNVDMTEAEWFATNDPFALLLRRFGIRSPDSATSDVRQLQRYFLTCAKRCREQLPWIGSQLVAVAEKLLFNEPQDPRLISAATAAAEELIHNTDFEEAIALAEQSFALADRVRPAEVPSAATVVPPPLWGGIAHLIYYAFNAKSPIFGNIPAELHCPDLIRDLFGNPFREVWFDPRWRTTTVCDLAHSIEKTGDFSRLPVLADALEEAGCTNDGVLEHLRTAQTHVPGCWVLEGLLRHSNRA